MKQQQVILALRNLGIIVIIQVSLLLMSPGRKLSLNIRPRFETSRTQEIKFQWNFLPLMLGRTSGSGSRLIHTKVLCHKMTTKSSNEQMLDLLAKMAAKHPVYTSHIEEFISMLKKCA